MKRLAVVLAVTVLLSGVPAVAEGEVVQRSSWRSVDLDGPMPVDFTDPSGKTRWELSDVHLSGVWSRTVQELETGELLVRESRDDRAPVRYGATAHDWWMPHLAAGYAPLQFSAVDERSSGTVGVTTRLLGRGWVFLPSGPREVRLEQSLVRRSDGTDRLFYRWIDSRAGSVAEIWGRPDATGGQIVEFEGAQTVESIEQGTPLQIYSFEIETTPFQRIAYGFDRRGTCTMGLNACIDDTDCAGAGDECLIPVDEVTTVAHATIGDLVNAGVWDFTATQLADARYELASTSAPINSNETCSSGECGFSDPGTTSMGREDKNFNNFTEPDRQDLFITLSATEGEQRAGDYSIWLRAGIRNEGITTGGLGENESRFCYSQAGTPEVPLWRFGTQDANGWYMQLGDTWGHSPFSCDQVIFNHVCPNSCPSLTCAVYAGGCSGYSNEGQQSSVVVAEGPVTLPSGHTMNALVVRQVVDFCVYPSGLCFIEAERVHQVIYLWVVPNIGTVARLMSEQNEGIDDTGFDDLMETDLKYGLFPPRSISSTGETDTTISISWDPGTITHHIDGYKVYWDTDSGASTTYAFDSVNNPGQVSIVGTTATISGLAPSTDYFITVTALSDYTSPATGGIATYESLLFPTATSGAGAPLPPELTVTTTGGGCTPTTEIDGVTMGKVGVDQQICWNASGDACVDGYTILGAGSPEASGNYSTVVADTGLVTCQTFNPVEDYFLVLGKGATGTGPWGHYGM